MVLSGLSAVAIVMAALFGGGFFGLPVSVPPLPADPVIERSATEHCLLHASLRGLAEPDGSSTNRTERLLADEEVQAFLRDLLQEVVKMAGAAAEAAGPPLPMQPITALLGVIATRPVSLTVEQLTLQSGRPPEIDALLILNPGAKRQAFDAALADILRGVLGGAGPGPGRTRTHAPRRRPDARLGLSEGLFHLRRRRCGDRSQRGDRFRRSSADARVEGHHDRAHAGEAALDARVSRCGRDPRTHSAAGPRAHRSARPCDGHRGGPRWPRGGWQRERHDRRGNIVGHVAGVRRRTAGHLRPWTGQAPRGG